jgi:hypothetical protein
MNWLSLIMLDEGRNILGKQFLKTLRIHVMQLRNCDLAMTSLTGMTVR